jgi:integrase/recombinase XerD
MLKTYLEQDEIQLIEEQATYIRDKLLIRLLARLGCRVSEALALKVADIDFSSSTVSIQHLKERVNISCPECQARLGRLHRFCPVCGRKVDKPLSRMQQMHRRRVLPLDEETMSMLRDFIRRDGTKGLIFDISRHRAWEIISGCARKARLSDLVNPETGKSKGISPHRLRDAFAVHAVQVDDSGDGLRLLQEHLGHQSITTTMRYRKVSGQEQKKWYQKLWNGGKPCQGKS